MATERRAPDGTAGNALLAVIVPELFLLSGLLIPARMVVPMHAAVTAVLPVLLLAVGSVGYAVDRFLTRERIPGFIAKLREGILVLAGSILLVWGLLRLSASDGRMTFLDAASTFDFWTVLILVSSQWLFTSAVYRSFRIRSAFLAAITRQGEEHLAEAYRDFADEAGDAAAALRRLRRMVAFFAVWNILLALIVEWILRVRLGWGEELFLALTLLLYLIVLKLLRDRAFEQSLLADGILLHDAERLIADAGAIILMAVSLVASILFALLPPALPESLIGALLAWIGGLFRGSPHAMAAPPPPPQLQPNFAPPEALRRLGTAMPSHPSQFLADLLRVLGWCLLGALIAAVIWLLVAPLFRARPPKGRLLSRLAQSLSRAVRGGLAGLAAWIRGIVSAMHSVGDVRWGEGRMRAIVERASSERSGRTGHQGLGAGSTHRFLRAFLKVIRWGERRGVAWSPSDGPLEYVRMVGSRTPESLPLLVDVALLYERQLYSPRPLPPEAVSEYYQKIRGVLRNERKIER